MLSNQQKFNLFRNFFSILHGFCSLRSFNTFHWIYDSKTFVLYILIMKIFIFRYLYTIKYDTTHDVVQVICRYHVNTCLGFILMNGPSHDHRLIKCGLRLQFHFRHGWIHLFFISKIMMPTALTKMKSRNLSFFLIFLRTVAPWIFQKCWDVEIHALDNRVIKVVLSRLPSRV